MDKIGLARLVAYIASKANVDFDRYSVETIDQIISDSAAPAAAVPSPRDVMMLIEYMATDRKIEAIKAYRMMTGMGLKESKDAIETVTNRFAVRAA